MSSFPRLVLLLALVAGLTQGCSPSQMHQRMARFWDNGIVGDDIGSLEATGDPWASHASQEMAGQHPPGYSDPSDRYFQSDRAREINAGLDGTR